MVGKLQFVIDEHNEFVEWSLLLFFKLLMIFFCFFFFQNSISAQTIDTIRASEPLISVSLDRLINMISIQQHPARFFESNKQLARLILSISPFASIPDLVPLLQELLPDEEPNKDLLIVGPLQSSLLFFLKKKISTYSQRRLLHWSIFSWFMVALIVPTTFIGNPTLIVFRQLSTRRFLGPTIA